MHAPLRVRRLFIAASLALLVAALASVDSAARAGEGPLFADYAVAADHPQASEAGAAILAAGGNAADAAAATMLALGVVHPGGSGLGGGGFALYYRASDKSLTFLDFRESAPAAATAEMFRGREGESAELSAARSQVGGLAVAVPGEPAGIAELVTRFGTKSLADVAKPAIELASTGFDTSAHLARSLGMLGDTFAKDPLLVAVFGPTPSAGAKAKNQALADTLRTLARDGARAFYRGAIAKDLVRAARAQGGMLTDADLAAYKVLTRVPMRARVLGHDWVTAPLPSAGGYTLLQSLAQLERYLPTDAHWHSPERKHALIESWKGPYLDRQRYFGDPDHADVPLAALQDAARLEARVARYHPLLAQAPEAFAVPLADTKSATTPVEDHGTSHLCVVDAQGNVAAVTTTINLPFGAHIAVRGLWLNDEMDDFAREVGKSNAFGLVGGTNNLPSPSKRPISSMSPTIVLEHESPVLCVGGSGGSRIPTAVEQVALHVLQDGLHPQQAIEAPRLHHQGSPNRVSARGLSEADLRELTLRGHVVSVSEQSAQVQAIRIGPKGPNRLAAASDPDKGGRPSGR